MMIGALFILMVVTILVVWVIGTYNHLSRLKHVADQAWTIVEEFLVRRATAVSHALLQSAKTGVIDSSLESLLDHAVHVRSIVDRAKAENSLSIGLEQLFKRVENNNVLASDNTLQSYFEKIRNLEQDIHLAQRFYNGAVKQYNHYLRTFPASSIAHILGWSQGDYFELFE